MMEGGVSGRSHAYPEPSCHGISDRRDSQTCAGQAIHLLHGPEHPPTTSSQRSWKRLRGGEKKREREKKRKADHAESSPQPTIQQLPLGVVMCRICSVGPAASLTATPVHQSHLPVYFIVIFFFPFSGFSLALSWLRPTAIPQRNKQVERRQELCPEHPAGGCGFADASR